MGGKIRLDEMFPTDLYFVWEGEDVLCRRLNGYYKEIGGLVFVPIEVVETGRREYVRMDLLKVIDEMEVIAWASK